jgi:hypothetical protein
MGLMLDFVYCPIKIQRCSFSSIFRFYITTEAEPVLKFGVFVLCYIAHSSVGAPK